jgi:hypothetical protein
VAVLDHHRIVEHGHVDHAAVGVAGVEIAPEQRILVGGWPVRHDRADDVAVVLEHAPQIGRGLELVDDDAHRDAGAAALAGRAVGDRLRAPEAALGEDLVHLPRAPADDVRENLSLLLAEKIRARRGGGEVELRGVARLAGHAQTISRPCGRGKGFV